MKHETMTEEWERENSIYSTAATETDRSSQDRAYQTGVSTGIAKCRIDVREAYKPRPPQAEWFGDPDLEPGKWDAWWIRWHGYHGHICYMVRATLEDNRIVLSWQILRSGDEPYRTPGAFADSSCMCVPVAREGFPCPVGWGVVGG